MKSTEHSVKVQCNFCLHLIHFLHHNHAETIGPCAGPEAATLFDRQGVAVTPTRRGKAFLRRAENRLGETDELVREIQVLKPSDSAGGSRPRGLSIIDRWHAALQQTGLQPYRNQGELKNHEYAAKRQEFQPRERRWRYPYRSVHETDRKLDCKTVLNIGS